MNLVDFTQPSLAIIRFKKVSDVNAVFTMQQTTNCFTQCKSAVFVSALDASKSFDKVSHAKLFIICVSCTSVHCILKYHYGNFTLGLWATYHVSVYCKRSKTSLTL